LEGFPGAEKSPSTDFSRHWQQVCRLGNIATANSSKFNERSGNVYENKGRAKKSTTPDPSLSKEGNTKLPSSDEEGLGVVGSFNLGVEREPAASQKLTNDPGMSMKTKGRFR